MKGKKSGSLTGMMERDSQRCSYQFIWKHRTSGIDTHIFFLCSNGIKRQLDEIAKTMRVGKEGKWRFPQKMYDEFKGLYGETTTYYIEDTQLLFVGYGDRKEASNSKCNPDALYNLALQVGKESECSGKSYMIHLVDQSNGLNGLNGSKDQMETVIHHQVSGFILGHYRFQLLKGDSVSNSKIHKKCQVYFYYPLAQLKRPVERFITMSRVQNEVRNLANLPQNILNADTYIRYLRHAVPSNVSVRVMRNAELKKNGMNLILGVNQGANVEAGLVIIEYASSSTEKKSDPVVLVGKGVMYDTGGYDLKTRGMLTMKYDMLGSAIMFGVIKSHALLETRGHYVALLPIVENLISGGAYLAGDVIRSRCGLMVEVTDTDAEGRLILADAICYACNKYKPKMMIDLGTLSGDAGYMFANKSALIMGNNYLLNRKLIETGMGLQEKIWELPMWAEYQDDLKSDVADIRSTGISGKAGAIIVGTFLANFVPKGVDWVHLDIAGVDYAQESPLLHNGAKGQILQTLVLGTE